MKKCPLSRLANPASARPEARGNTEQQQPGTKPVWSRRAWLAFQGLSAMVLAIGLGSNAALAQGRIPLSDTALGQIAVLLKEKASRTVAQQKLDSQLVYASKADKSGIIFKDIPTLKLDLNVNEDRTVLVDITGKVSQDLLAAIEEHGGKVMSSVAELNGISAFVPLESLEALAEREDVRFIEPAADFTTNTGTVNSQGDLTHRAADARSVFGVNGTGIRVGVLSDSVDFLAASQLSGNLGPVTVLPGQSGVPGTGEGTAMLEIVADLAPNAGLFFATGNGGPINMAANILALRAAGCQIIVDDLTYFNESPFQDGPIAQAVNIVSASGGMYFSSARNSGNLNDATSSTWEGDFANGGPAAVGGRLHNFGGGTTFNTVLPGGSKRRVDLFWSDPLNGSGNDYDLFVFDPTGTFVVASSTSVQNGSQNPYESVSTLNVGERVVIVQKPGAANRFLHLDIGRGRLAISTAGCVRGHNASGAPNAFSVAATDIANSSPNPFTGGIVNPVETFSSDGLRRMFYKPNGTPFTPGNFSSTGGIILNKPDIAAADGGSTSVPGFGSFFGTSAAAPHAAAIAALLLSFNPALTPAQIRAALASSALDIEGAGFDRDSGSGIVMAFGAMKVINPCTIVCPANISVSNDPGQCGAIVKYPNPRTRGGCGGVTCNPPSGFFFPKGITKVTCTSASEDSCSFTVTVKDTEPPQITCPADITVGNDPGQCSAVVTYTVKVTDNCPGATVVCVPPSGAVFPKGTTLVNCTAKDEAGNKANCGFSVTVKDIEPPVVTASVAQASLWPPNHNLINVGLTVTATDNCPGPLPITVNVYSDEDDETATGDGNFSPDAKDVAPNTLRLRQERKGDDDGRVYLIVSSTTDGSGNVGFACTTVVVPHSKNPADIASVDAQAAAAMAWCQTHNGSAPPGFVVVGDGPIVGPKQ